ncbi:MAG: winged helix-turn-helix domain-containing protein [Rhodospirillales bacterium]|nr:MAG: winged helix-turn-helix domain-containing protein [Rhodospirillales bacterium]
MATSQHIAVVDDEAQIRAAVGEYLELHGFRVSLADGGQALRGIMAKGPPVDLVVLDLNMPGEDGLSIARRLREHSRVGIVILTAAGQTLDRIVGLEVGADDYMAKPFDLRELLARIKSVLRRIPSETAPDAEAIRFGNLTLDTQSHALTDASGKDIPLTTMEYDLLRALAESPNRVLSREQLLDKAHRRDGDPFDRSIDVRIARLRRKIEQNPAKPRFIKTIRGAGYVFVPEPEN